MSLLYRLKAALLFTRFQAWVDAPLWDKADEKNLLAFLESPTGNRLRAMLLNTSLRQQAHALNQTKDLVFEAGYCAGQKATICQLTAWSGANNISELGDTDADPATLQEAS